MALIAPVEAPPAYPPCIACGSTGERRADKRMKSGWSSYCRVCANTKSLEWKRNNQDRQLSTTTAWRLANPEKVKATRIKNVDKERAAAIEWRRNNPERAKANDAAWRANNPEKARLKDQLRRARKISAVRGLPITKETIDELHDRQMGLCAYCEQPLGSDRHIDHFVPLAKDGEHSIDNLLLACKKCNLQKGAKDPIDFMEQNDMPQNPTSEAREQSLVIVWSHKKSVRDLMPVLKFLHHSPNGEKRDVRTGNKLKAMGVKPGFPDLILPAWSAPGVLAQQAPGLVIEMKSATGSLSPEQKDWQDHFISQAWVFRLARSAQEARSYLCQYLGIDPETAPPLAD